jgi:hypothetical protein
MNRITILSALALVTALSGSAQAASPHGSRQPQADQSTQRERQARGDFTHDGFYLRFALGFGAFSDALSSRDENASGETSQGVVSGVSSVGEITVGGSLTPHFILGGGVWTSTVLASGFTATDGDVPSDLHEPDNFTIVGPFVNWYFASRSFEPSGGFHLQGGLGLAVLNGFRPEQVRHDERRVAVGPGFVAGFGYEWWIHEQWGMGVLARLTAAGLIEKDERDDYWYHGVATFPAFLFSATYN